MEQKRDLGEFGHKHLQCFHRLVPKSVDVQWAAGEVAGVGGQRRLGGLVPVRSLKQQHVEP